MTGNRRSPWRPITYRSGSWGKHFLNRRGLVNAIAGGWQLSTFGTLQKGSPFGSQVVNGPRTLLGDPAAPQLRPNVNGELNSSSQGNPAVGVRGIQWLNPAAFTNTVVPLFGNCGHNNLIGPWQVNFDISVIKEFRITERHELQLRTEMFNAPNHVELGNPATGWGSSNVLPQATFGTITSTRASMRQIQFALKYNF